jgi:hypothetical protein
MKKIILAVILLAAAGGGAYYLLKKQKNPLITIDKELVTGKWKIDSLVAANDSSSTNFALLLFAMDSNAKKLVYDFQPDGRIYVTNPADSSLKKDTSSFIWGKEKEIFWKEKIADTTSESMTVIKLEKEEFVLQSKDSILVYFRKQK